MKHIAQSFLESRIFMNPILIQQSINGSAVTSELIPVFLLEANEDEQLSIHLTIANLSFSVPSMNENPLFITTKPIYAFDEAEEEEDWEDDFEDEEEGIDDEDWEDDFEDEEEGIDEEDWEDEEEEEEDWEDDFEDDDLEDDDLEDIE